MDAPAAVGALMASMTDAEVELRCETMRAEYEQMAANAISDQERLFYKLAAQLQPGLERWSFNLSDPLPPNGILCQIFAAQMASLFVQFLHGAKCPAEFWEDAIRRMLHNMEQNVLQQAAEANTLPMPKVN